MECRICMGIDGELVSPCECRGSVGFVHPECLGRWHAIIEANENGHDGLCRTCHSPDGSRVTKKSLFEKVAIELVAAEDPQTASDLLMFICDECLHSYKNSELAVEHGCVEASAAAFKKYPEDCDVTASALIVAITLMGRVKSLKKTLIDEGFVSLAERAIDGSSSKGLRLLGIDLLSDIDDSPSGKVTLDAIETMLDFGQSFRVQWAGIRLLKRYFDSTRDLALEKKATEAVTEALKANPGDENISMAVCSFLTVIVSRLFSQFLMGFDIDTSNCVDYMGVVVMLLGPTSSNVILREALVLASMTAACSEQATELLKKNEDLLTALLGSDDDLVSAEVQEALEWIGK